MTSKETNPRRGALGRGISSLLGDAADSKIEGMTSTTRPTVVKDVEAEIIRLKLDQISPNPNQPRKVFDEAKLKELADSVRQDGLLQPIVVGPTDEENKYIIIAGERRWRASKIAGLEYIPAVIKEGVDDDLLRLGLIENIQRDDLNIIEEAEAYASLIKDYGLTQEMCASRVGKDRSTVANALRLLQLPRMIQDDIMDSRLTMGHGRAILSLEDQKLMRRARDMVVKKGLSVRQTEQLCKSFKDGKAATKKGDGLKDADLNYIAESLRSHLHTKVKVSGTAAKGKIEISYFSASEMERILKQMGYPL
jgi:ParB family chromosome partitioning protein